MQGVLVGIAVHGDSPDAELLGGTHDSQRDLTPVRDQDLVKHAFGTDSLGGHASTRDGVNGPDNSSVAKHVEWERFWHLSTTRRLLHIAHGLPRDLHRR